MNGSLRLAGAGLVLALLMGCGQPGGGQGVSPPLIRVDGSSTVFPVSEKVAEAFMTAQRGRVRVAVAESGTGGGFAKFCRGETEFQGASRPITREEMAACEEAGITYVEMPVVFDGITVVVNPSNPVASMTLEELRRLWEPAAEGVVVNWRQVNPDWPDLDLRLYGAGTASGTFDFFTEAVMGQARASRVDYTPTEDDNVTVQGVSSNPGGIGYFGIAYYEQNRDRLRAVALDNGNGPIEPTLEAVANGAYQPLSRPLFVYVRAHALQRPEVRQFALFYLSHAAEGAQAVGYVPLPDASYTHYAERITQLRTGTAFNGQTAVGLTMEELKQRPLSDEPLQADEGGSP